MTTKLDPAVDDFLACLHRARAAGWRPLQGRLFAYAYDDDGLLKRSACTLGAALLGAGYLSPPNETAEGVREVDEDVFEAMCAAEARWPTIDLLAVAVLDDREGEDAVLCSLGAGLCPKCRQARKDEGS